jgi:hypothetical protein
MSKNLEEVKSIFVFSHRIGEILVTEHGLINLIEIKYLPKKNEDNKFQKVYVFKNSPELLNTFKEYAYKKENPPEEIHNDPIPEEQPKKRGRKKVIEAE